MKRIVLFFVGLALFLVFTHLHTTSTFAAGANFYVDCNGGNDSNNGQSTTAAWKTLDAIRNHTFQPGDTINLLRGCSWDSGYKNGSLTEDQGLQFQNSGTSSAPITLTAYGTGAAPNISDTYNGTIYVEAITVNGSWVVIQNLKISNVNEGGIDVNQGASNVTIQNNEITNTGIGIIMYGDHTKVLHNTVHDLRMVLNKPSDNSDYGANAVELDGSNAEIAYNHFYNCINVSLAFSTDGGGVEFYAHGTITSVSNNFIHHNIFENGDGGSEFGSSNNALFSNNIFAYNIFSNNGGNVLGFHVADSFASQYSGNVFINNTIYENPSEYNFSANRESPLTEIGIWGGSLNASALKFENNIVYTTNIPKMASSDTFTHLYNDYFMTGGSVYTLGTGEMTVDPQLVSVSNHNFHLLSTSPVIGKGSSDIVTLGFTTDYDGFTVPSVNGVDIGAYEYTNGNTIPTPTSTPSAAPTPSCALPALAGNTNSDNAVDGIDYVTVINHFGQNILGPSNGDVNCDGAVNQTDLNIVINGILTNSTNPTSTPISVPTNTPGTGVLTTYMQDINQSYGLGLYPAARSTIGEFVSATSLLSGKAINTEVLTLRKIGSPSGTATVGVYDTNQNLLKTIGTIDVSTVSTNYTNYTFSLPSGQSYTLQPGQVVGINYTQGDGSNYIDAMIDSSGAFDGGNSYLTYFYSGSWQNYTTYDASMTLQGF